MKAEFNETGILELHPETKKESDAIYYWMQENKGRIIIPKERYELAVARFSTLDIAVFAEPVRYIKTKKASLESMINDAKMALAHFKKMGINPSGIAVSANRKLSKKERKVLDYISSEIHKNTPIPDISIDNFNNS